MLLHPDDLQNPNTPKLTPRKEPKGMAVMMGVDRTEINNRAKAANSNTERGVAGLSMAAKAYPRAKKSPEESKSQLLRDGRRVVVVLLDQSRDSLIWYVPLPRAHQWELGCSS
jgi:hypothetical protein